LVGLAVPARPLPVLAEVTALIAAGGGLGGSFALAWPGNRQVSASVEAVDADGPSDFADAFARVDQDRCLLREFES
jgi:hypothetical protein